ncbi:hypothetical protein Tsp_06397 [Trichinella spiralis]|nr:hypothetical protein Tsp_06397 [Trichinella spiralis]
MTLSKVNIPTFNYRSLQTGLFTHYFFAVIKPSAK